MFRFFINRKSFFIINFSVIIILLSTICCDTRKHSNPFDPDYEGGGNPTMNQVNLPGILKLIPGSTVPVSDLEVATFAEASNIGANGDFSVQSNVAEKYQALFFNHVVTKIPVYIGLFNPILNKVVANDSSTALALTLFNPYLFFTTQAQREQYIEKVKQLAKFAQLLELIKNAHQADAKTALDYETNPTIYQLACQLMREAMESLPGFKGMQKTAIGVVDPPTIEDVVGDGINFVNPRYVWYAAGIYPDGNNLKEIVTIDRKTDITSFSWGWPPVINCENKETGYNLGNGNFTLDVTKGGDFTKINQWNDLAGRATICNAAQTMAHLMDLIIGNNTFFSDNLILSFPQYFHLTTAQALALSEAIGSQDVESFIINFTESVINNLEDISYWIWQDTPSNATYNYLKNAMTIFKNVSLVFKLMGYLDEDAPFLGDLIFAPRDVTYMITQTNGTITSTQQNDPPVAEFSVNPPAGIVGTTFTFNASATTDDHDNLASLLFRWDWNTDGTWDVGWNSNPSATYSYAEAGAYSVTLEVKDSHGLIGSVIHIVNVGGGAGTATHVKLFQDNLPWSNNSMVVMLQNLGFTEGTGPNTYEIIASAQMASAPLIPGEDLVIIANDQNQNFYNNYAAVQVRFTNFVYMGGALFWEACDEGWANGSIVDAGIVLPGNLSTQFDYDYWNYVTDTNLPLVSGLPDSMDHNYASHESFSNLPDGTTVYCVDESYNPTLIEFNLGGGWIIVTGQPLEHQYENIYGASDMEKLLPRIVSYFTGKTLPKSLPKRVLPASVRASH